MKRIKRSPSTRSITNPTKGSAISPSAKNLLRCNAPLLLCRTFLSCALYLTPTIQSIPLPRRALRSTSSFPTQYFLPSQIQCSLPCQTGSRLHPIPCVLCQPQRIMFFTRLIWYTVLLTRCGGANDGRTPILGCTQEPRRKAAYCIDIVVCVE